MSDRNKGTMPAASTIMPIAPRGMNEKKMVEELGMAEADWRSLVEPSSAGLRDRPPHKIARDWMAESKIPQDQPLPAKVMAPLATLSSILDPFPHFLTAGACFFLGVQCFYHPKPRVQNFGKIAWIYGGMYGLAACFLAADKPRQGYDLGSITSLAAVATAYRGARRPGDVYSAVLMGIGGISAVANLIKSVETRTGYPHEMQAMRNKQ